MLRRHPQDRTIERRRVGIAEIRGCRVGIAATCTLSLAIAATSAGAGEAVRDSSSAALVTILSGAHEFRIRKLAPRSEAPGVWDADQSSAWVREAASPERRLNARRGKVLVNLLADSRFPRPTNERLLEELERNCGPEDCDFLLTTRRPAAQFLLLFPEMEIRWLEPDSAMHSQRFRAHGREVAGILAESFPRDSAIQDLPAAVEWVLRGPTQHSQEGEHVSVFEGQPQVVARAPCAPPEFSRSARIEGTVLLEVMLDRIGRVRFVRVKRSIPVLDAWAMDCLRRWTFKPGEFNGHPLAFRVTVPVKFVLE